MNAVIVQAGDGRVFARPATGGSVTIKVASGAVTVFEARRKAGDAGGPGLHSHQGFDETFYVLSGEWEFVAGDETVIAAAGTVVHLPRGVPHAFRSTGREDGTLLGVANPGGIEEFFEEAARTSDDEAAGLHHGIRWAKSMGATHKP